jgi:hypothetical protein
MVDIKVVQDLFKISIINGLLPFCGKKCMAKDTEGIKIPCPLLHFI